MIEKRDEAYELLRVTNDDLLEAKKSESRKSFYDVQTRYMLYWPVVLSTLLVVGGTVMMAVKSLSDLSEFPIIFLFFGSGSLATACYWVYTTHIKQYKQAETIQEKWIKYKTDEQLEERLLRDILTPSKQEEVWTRIETYKANGGDGANEPGWRIVGDKRIYPTSPSGYDENSQFILTMLMETYGKLPRKAARDRVSRMRDYEIEYDLSGRKISDYF